MSRFKQILNTNLGSKVIACVTYPKALYIVYGASDPIGIQQLLHASTAPGKARRFLATGAQSSAFVARMHARRPFSSSVAVYCRMYFLQSCTVLLYIPVCRVFAYPLLNSKFVEGNSWIRLDIAESTWRKTSPDLLSRFCPATTSPPVHARTSPKVPSCIALRLETGPRFHRFLPSRRHPSTVQYVHYVCL
jgi:hypothetical protein